MRIAMLTNNYKPFMGGVPIAIERLSEGLRAFGHEVYICAPNYENQEEEAFVVRYKSLNKKLKGGEVIPYPINLEIEKLFKEMDFDIIHVHHPHFVGWAGQYLSKKYHIPLVYTYHTRYEHYLTHLSPFRALEKLSAQEKGYRSQCAGILFKAFQEQVIPYAITRYTNTCDAVIAPTQLMKDVLKDKGVVTPIEVLPTGLDASFYTYEEQTVERIRASYKGDKKFLFCTVARLAPEKNMAFMLEGIRVLKEKIGPVFRIMIIGDGPMREVMQQKIQEDDLEDEVCLISHVDNHVIKNYYAASDLFLFTSKSETQGMVLLEAMAAHTPVVAIEASGVVEVVKNGVNGYMTSDCLEAWTESIVRILQDKVHHQQLSENAYKTACHYTIPMMAQQVVTCYEALQHNALRNTQRKEKTHAKTYRKVRFNRSDVSPLYKTGYFYKQH